jgi:NAD(P)-dependent dehydrogenase (short-subunit alcohol dehydrogenase family)
MQSSPYVVITGAASGIGRATAQAFARRGARLLLCDRDAEPLAALSKELASHVELAERVDVSDRAAMAAFAAAAHAITPAVDVLVNNAGVAFAGRFLDTSLDDFDWVINVNLRGVVHGCHYFAPAMVARGGGGQIINLSSVLGFWGAPQVSAYVASKFAVLGFSQSLRAELAQHRVGVTAICPGMIATSIVDRARYGTTIDGRRDQLVNLFAKRGATPAVVAEAIVAAAASNPAMRPVAMDGWLLWAMTRLTPGLRDRIGRAISERWAER